MLLLAPCGRSAAIKSLIFYYKPISPDGWDAEVKLTIKSAVAFQLCKISVAGAKDRLKKGDFIIFMKNNLFFC